MRLYCFASWWRVLESPFVGPAPTWHTACSGLQYHARLPRHLSSCHLSFSEVDRVRVHEKAGFSSLPLNEPPPNAPVGPLLSWQLSRQPASGNALLCFWSLHSSALQLLDS